jgi:hypothetical protein
MLPVVLYFLGLPKDVQSARVRNQDFAADDVAERLVLSSAPATVGAPAAPSLIAGGIFMAARQGRTSGGVVTRNEKRIEDISFARLERAASSDPGERRRLEGQAVTIIGKFTSTRDPRQFGLVRLQRACCAADAIPLDSKLIVHPDWKGTPLDARGREQKWVQVTGRIFFLPARGGNKQFVTAVILFPGDEKDDKGGTKTWTPNDLVEVISQPANPYID